MTTSVTAPGLVALGTYADLWQTCGTVHVFKPPFMAQDVLPVIPWHAPASTGPHLYGNWHFRGSMSSMLNTVSE